MSRTKRIAPPQEVIKKKLRPYVTMTLKHEFYHEVFLTTTVEKTMIIFPNGLRLFLTTAVEETLIFRKVMGSFIP